MLVYKSELSFTVSSKLAARFDKQYVNFFLLPYIARSIVELLYIVCILVDGSSAATRNE